jgi:antitoxin StbD
MTSIYANYSASISELKKSPSNILKESHGEPVAILNHNKPSAYLLTAELYEILLEKLDDISIKDLIEERRKNSDDFVEVNIDEL